MASQQQTSPRAHRLRKRTVLVVDDDHDIRSSFELAIRAEGAIIRSAADGNEALAQSADGQVDAVVLDMMLPKRSGFLVLEKFAELETMPVVIMVTANQGKRHKLYAESLGVHRYLYKPVALQQLIDSLVELLDLQDKLLAGDEGEDDAS